MMIPSPLLQVVLINAVKDVAKALAELISATKCAAGKAADDPSMYQLKSAAKVSATEGPCLSMWKAQLQVAGTAAAPLTCRGGVGLLPPLWLLHLVRCCHGYLLRTSPLLMHISTE